MRFTPTTRSDRPPRPRRRLGFTLVELLVALLLVEVGLLSLTGTTLVLIRERSAVRARAAAIRAASNRLQFLAAGPCEAASGAAIGPTTTREMWDVRLVPNAVRELRDSVVYRADSEHAIVLRTRLPC
ncbi:MAG TPA: prepilin-type N-terminal cleavage/methylation domain-containing protein [Gemmatimonadaceae bacterium]|nr:prepilin-type N-terminal cleavage/methylation domain-containing protein [Gemmatimonadaceae bacterium]